MKKYVSDEKFWELYEAEMDRVYGKGRTWKERLARPTLVDRHRYESWERHVCKNILTNNPTPEQFAEAQEKSRAIPLEEFFEHQFKQILLAKEKHEWSDFIPPGAWNNLTHAVQNAVEVLMRIDIPESDASEVATAFYHLGQTVSELENQEKEVVLFPALDGADQARKYERSEQKRTRGLSAKNAMRAAGSEAQKKFVQKTALELWEQDADKRIRVGEMRQLVYPKMFEQEWSTELPVGPDSTVFKAWISDVAPRYAKKRGPKPKK